jgi:tRNA threonylcarbamoyladenosine modification (KEOPS) complex  Pcc1 subunit
METLVRVPLASTARARFAKGMVVAAHGKAVDARTRGRVLEVAVRGERFADLRAKATSLFRDLKVVLDAMELVRKK